MIFFADLRIYKTEDKYTTGSVKITAPDFSGAVAALSTWSAGVRFTTNYVILVEGVYTSKGRGTDPVDILDIPAMRVKFAI